jgi:cytochrome c-type biogenesis protein CcmH
MRAIIRERVEAGDSEEDVKAYFVSKYGDYILMEPRRTGFNWALWLFPFVALAIGLFVIRAKLQQAKHAGAAPVEAPVEDHTQELIAALREPAAEKDTETK